MENGWEMGRIKGEESGSEPSSVDPGRDVGGFDPGEGKGHEEKWTHLRQYREDEQTELDREVTRRVGFIF